jgi:hypothetical protein
MTLDELQDKAWSENPDFASLNNPYTDRDGRIWPSVVDHDKAVILVNAYENNLAKPSTINHIN